MRRRLDTVTTAIQQENGFVKHISAEHTLAHAHAHPRTHARTQIWFGKPSLCHKSLFGDKEAVKFTFDVGIVISKGSTTGKQHVFFVECTSEPYTTDSPRRDQ